MGAFVINIVGLEHMHKKALLFLLSKSNQIVHKSAYEIKH